MLSSINLIFSARFVEQGSNVWQYVFTFNLHSKDANRVKLEAIILNNLSKKGSRNFPFLLNVTSRNFSYLIMIYILMTCLLNNVLILQGEGRFFQDLK